MRRCGSAVWMSFKATCFRRQETAVVTDEAAQMALTTSEYASHTRTNIEPGPFILISLAPFIFRDTAFHPCACTNRLLDRTPCRCRDRQRNRLSLAYRLRDRRPRCHSC